MLPSPSPPRASDTSCSASQKRIQKCAERMLEIAVNGARALDILHQVHTVSHQCAVNALEPGRWFGLVVNAIERRDALVRWWPGGRVEIAEIAPNEHELLKAERRDVALIDSGCLDSMDTN